ncbi:MAG: NAD-dependent epimerase/dehydratase family protein, partial [Chitinophagaceae bacterium]|nr:NAD-dependent epimerase/dehydratase family protein [Rubrivivax sp.]
AGLPVGTGLKRTGRRLLTVGTDCASGKKYTALALDRAWRARGGNSDFRATGQTGIMIAGQGLPLDAVVSDFVTGAAEMLSPDNTPDHWDMIEGQGGIFHPGYLQVTIGLLVGSQPDALVVCHDPLRTVISGWPGFKLPSVREVIDRSVLLGSLTNAAIRCVGVSLNTHQVPAVERQQLLERYADETGLPCVDPLIDGVTPILDKLQQEFAQ